MKKYKGAVSDTDIIVHLATIKRLDVLELIFEEVIIPKEVYDREVVRKAGKSLHYISGEIHKEGSIFRIVNQEDNKALKLLARPVIEDKKQVIGYGESVCAGYAHALRIAIIVSNNSTEFKWIPEFITLTYYDLLYICTEFKLLSFEEANDVYNSVNSLMSYPSGKDFRRRCRDSKERIADNSWNEYLKMSKL